MKSNGIDDIKVGDRVRAFDFPQYGRHMPADTVKNMRNCHADGIVESVGVVQDICPRYKIRIEKRVFNSREISFDDEPYVFPPVNGMPDTFGGITNNVELIEGAEEIEERELRKS